MARKQHPATTHHAIPQYSPRNQVKKLYPKSPQTAPQRNTRHETACNAL